MERENSQLKGEKKENLIPEISDILHEFHKECLREPHNGEPILRRARKESYAKEIIKLFEIICPSKAK